MTNENLHQILLKINNNSYHDIAIASISHMVDFCNIIDEYWGVAGEYLHDFFLIKNRNANDINEKYVGIVLDMEKDMHFYILPEYRQMGYLKEVLNQYILPFLAYYNFRERQKLSIRNADVVDDFVKVFEFIKVDSNSVFKDISYMRELYKPNLESFDELTVEDRNELKKELTSAIRILKMIEVKLNLYKHKSFDYLYEEGEVESIANMFWNNLSS